MNDIKDLKDLAEYTARHFGSEWSSALIGLPEENYHGIICEEKGEELVRTENDELKNSWICDYLEAVDPSTILQIIDKLVLLEALAKELEAEKEKYLVECAAAKIAVAYAKGGKIDFTLNTPNFDAIKRQWMAEGVDQFAQYCFNKRAIRFWDNAGDEAKTFAAQLRQPEEKGHA